MPQRPSASSAHALHININATGQPLHVGVNSLNVQRPQMALLWMHIGMPFLPGLVLIDLPVFTWMSALVLSQ